MAEDVYCRNCGVRLRRGWLIRSGTWVHAQQLGPMVCRKPEPESPPPSSSPAPGTGSG
jgi:hypothetical protein